MAKKRKISLIVTSLLLLCITLTSCGHTTDSDPSPGIEKNQTDMICGVLLGKIPFINSETGHCIYIDDITLLADENFENALKPVSFAFIDIDSDGNDEAIVSLESEWDGYRMILHYNQEVVYGYGFSARWLQDVFTDGSFLMSGGASDEEVFRITFSGKEATVTECSTNISDLEFFSSWIDFTEKNIRSFLSKKNVDFDAMLNNNDILKQEETYSKACDLANQGDYESALELFESLDGYADSKRIISAINAIPLVTEIQNEILSSTYHLSLVGIDVYCEYSPIDYTFTKVWEMTNDGLYGELSQVMSEGANQPVSYDSEGMRSVAEDMYFDYFYSHGILDINCTVEVRDYANGVNQSGTFGLKDIPTKSVSGFADYDEVSAYANMRGLVIEDGVLIEYTGIAESLEIPEDVIGISPCAFEGNENIKEIWLPDTIANIDYGTFYGCTNLTSIHLPDSLEAIGEYAFFNCSNLLEIALPSGLTRIDEGAFGGCKSLVSITIPSTVTLIGDSAFAGCSSLTSIELPECLNEISDCLFYGCESLRNLDLPGSIVSIGYQAFYDCDSLEMVTLPDSLTSFGEPFSDNINELYFSGTIEAWNALMNPSLGCWVPDQQIVHCIDGDWNWDMWDAYW